MSLRRAVDQDCCDIADEDGTSVAAAAAYAGGVVVADSDCLQPLVFLENTDLLPGVFGITPKTDKQTNKQTNNNNNNNNKTLKSETKRGPERWRRINTQGS